MPSWKKVITSGSNAAFNSLTVSNTITGSISGSLTGSLLGTATTASYVLSSNVYGPNGFNSVSYASNAGSATTATTATNITSPVTQDLIISGTVNINGNFTNKIAYTNFDTLITNYNTLGSGYGYSGEVFISNAVAGFNIDSACTYNSLLSHYNSNKWIYVEAWKDNSKGMLGFYVKDPNTDEEGILTEGYIVLNGANIDQPSIGAPLWFYQADAGGGNPVSPPVPYKTSFYNGSSPFTIYQRLLGHLCYTDGGNPGLWILRFKPSNDWVQI